MNYIINDIRTSANDKLNSLYEDLSKLIVNNNTSFANTSNDTDIGTQVTELKSYVEDNELRTARTTEAYWTLAKTLEGLDEKTTNQREYTKTNEEIKSEVWDYDKSSLLAIIKEMGQWYVDNVYTYSGGNYGVYRYKYPTKKADKDNVEWYKTYSEWGQPLYDSNSSPIYLAGNNGRVGQVQNSSGNNMQISIIEDESKYQSEWKEKFRFHLENAGDEAKAKRLIKLNELGYTGDEILESDTDVDEWKLYEPAFNDKDVKTRKQNGKNVIVNQTKPEPRLWYVCDKIGGKKARDDCSAFVSTVIYKYLTEVLKVDYTYDPYMTSGKFYNKKNSILDTIGTWFDCYEGTEDTKNSKMLEKAKPLQPGDIMVRNGHLEFYLNANESFGWGKTHNSYKDNSDSKAFRYHFGQDDEADVLDVSEGYYFYNFNDKDEGKYTKVYRLKEEYQKRQLKIK